MVDGFTLLTILEEVLAGLVVTTPACVGGIDIKSLVVFSQRAMGQDAAHHPSRERYVILGLRQPSSTLDVSW